MINQTRIFLLLGVMLPITQGSSLLSKGALQIVGSFLKPNAAAKMSETNVRWTNIIGIYEIAVLNKHQFTQKFIIKMKESDKIEGIYLEKNEDSDEEESIYTDEDDSSDEDDDELEDSISDDLESLWESDWKNEYLNCFDEIAKFYKPFASFEFAADGGEDSDDFDWWMWVVGTNKHTGETKGYKCFLEVDSTTGDVLTVEEFNPVESGFIKKMEARHPDKHSQADNIYALLLSHGYNFIFHNYPNDIIFAIDTDLPMTCYTLFEHRSIDVNKIHSIKSPGRSGVKWSLQMHDSDFSSFQYAIHKKLPYIALKMMKYCDVKVLQKDGNGCTVFEYHRPHFDYISRRARYDWSKLDEKLQRKAQYERVEQEEASLKRKREKENIDKKEQSTESKQMNAEIQYSFEFLERTLDKTNNKK